MKPPAIDLEETKNFIRWDAARHYPNEACGLILAMGKKQQMMSCNNVAEDKRHDFLLDPAEFRWAEENSDEILMSYHTHCDESPTPSFADKWYAERNGLPALILSWPANTWEWYIPDGWKPELIGRPFVYGIMDCWVLWRDYYRDKLNIELPQFLYKPDWPQTGGDLFMENFAKNGFVRVDDLQEHDVLLMQLSAPVVNHCAVYLGDGLILHHPPGHLSGTHPYVADRGYYSQNTRMTIRHKKLLKK
jgi:proteasome lid subunit RPN8/RPN11